MEPDVIEAEQPGDGEMNSPERHHDMKFLLAGIALLVSGLIFLGASIGIYTLNSHFTQGFLALMAGLGFLAAARLQPKMTWAWIPAGLFLIYGAKQLIDSWRPGAQFMPTVVMWGMAVGLLLAFRPSAGRCVIFNTDADSFHGHPRPLRIQTLDPGLGH